MSLISVDIPYDIYESDKEMVVILPLAWVNKENLSIALDQYTLTIIGKRVEPILKSGLQNVKQDCYWGEFTQSISLPQWVFFEKIHSQFAGDNILTITIPKLQIPENIKITIQ